MNTQLNPALLAEFLAWRELKEYNLTIPLPIGHNPLCHDKQSREGLCMLGHIRTKERCPKCGGKFTDNNSLMYCSACILQGEVIQPQSYFIDLYWKVEGRPSVRLKIYSDGDRPFKNYFQTWETLTKIRLEIQEKRFDPRSYIAKDLNALKFINYSQEWLNNYRKLGQKNNLAPTTIDNAANIIENHLVPAFGKFDIRDIQDRDIENLYINLPIKLKQSTQKNIFSCLRHILKDAYRRRDIKAIPEYMPDIKVNKPFPKWINEEDQDAVISNIAEAYRPIFIFLIRTGCRPGEARALHWEDIDWQNRQANICRNFSDNEYRQTTKTHGDRKILLDDEVMSILAKIRQLSGFVFPDKGEPYHRVKLNYLWNRACKKTGVKINLYNGTRHSFASQAINRGEPIALIAMQLGHSVSYMTERYAHIDIESCRSILRPAGEIRKIKSEKN